MTLAHDHLNVNEHIFKSGEFKGIVEGAISFFSTTPAYHIPPPIRFTGCGVYGLYYQGSSGPYNTLGELNREELSIPIYIGKAVPSGWRLGRERQSDHPELYQRIREHTNNIKKAINLEVNDFLCKFIILGDIEIDLVVPVEAELIRRYQPLWNTVVDGFGNHDPGMGRYNQAVSDWDMLHPGRPWVKKLTGSKPDKEEIELRIRQYTTKLRLP